MARSGLSVVIKKWSFGSANVRSGAVQRACLRVKILLHNHDSTEMAYSWIKDERAKQQFLGNPLQNVYKSWPGNETL